MNLMKPHVAFTSIIFTTEKNQAKFCGKIFEACQASTESYFFVPLRNWSMFFVLKAMSGSASGWQIFLGSFLIFPLKLSLTTETYGLLSWGLTFTCKNIFYRSLQPG